MSGLEVAYLVVLLLAAAAWAMLSAVEVDASVFEGAERAARG